MGAQLDLLLEDAAMLAESAELHLTRSQIETTALETFTLAEDALAYLRSTACASVDAVLLDIRMPRMSGFEFLEAALEEFGGSFARVVVFMLTTSLDPRDRDRAQKFELVKHYFEKPLTREHLELVAATLSGSGERP